MQVTTLKKQLFIVAMIIVAIFSFSALSTPAYADSGGMVDKCLKEDVKSKECAQNSPTTKTGEDSNTNTSGMTVWDYTKIIASLIFVIVLLYGVLKLVNRNNKKYQSNQLLQSLGGISLGQQKSIQLVKVGNALFIIGVGDDVTILKEVTDEREQQHLLKLHEDKQVLASQVPYVMELITNAKEKLQGKKRNKNEEDVPTNEANFKSELDKKLHQIKNDRRQNLDDWQQKETKDDE